MTRVALRTADPLTAAVDAVVVGAWAATGPDGGPVATDLALQPLVDAAALAGATGRPGTVTTVPGTGLLAAPRAVVVGLGPAPAAEAPTGTPTGTPTGPAGTGTAWRDADGAVLRADTAERIRAAAGLASRTVAGRDTVLSTLGAVDLAAATEGHLLGAYVFETYKQASPAPVATVELTAPAGMPTAEAEATLARAAVVAGAVAMARDLVNTAPNDLDPATFAERAIAAAATVGLSTRVWDEQQLREDGFGGILAVGAGSSRPPRLVTVSHEPADPMLSVALVGKGITFDSGGISIKPAANMHQMTSDMAGAAAVLATVVAAAQLELPIAVTGYLPLAENLPSGTAQRPGDVLRHYGGRTSHVLNTDAEGRLVLADALVLAGQRHPDLVVETSTLTGAQIVALGRRTVGVMGSAGLRDRIAELGREVGEPAWAMPLPEELREGLDSSLADIANVAGAPAGGMLVAGHYLREFVPEGTPWAHLDVAGPAFHDGKAYGYTTPGGTGRPVRTFLALLQELAGSRH